MNDLLNALGLAIGLALYTMLLAMVVRDRTRGGRFDLLPLATGLLGVVWNLCSLLASVLPRLDLNGAAQISSVAGLAALGFLPAVVVHSVVRGPRGEPRSRASAAMLVGAYGASAAAASTQIMALALGDAVPSVLGLRLLTASFVALAVPLVVITRRQPGGRRALWVAALSAFAVSALHLSGFHEPGTAWPVELVGHHASIPLAVAILYQDYPFALADLFLKRALLLIALAGAALLGLTIGGMADAGSPAQLAIHAGGWVITALAYPWLRRGTHWFVDTVILARPDYRWLESAVIGQLQSDDSTDAVLDRITREVGGALNAQESTWGLAAPDASGRPLGDRRNGGSAAVAIPTSEPPRYVLEFRHLSGGRRILSDDVTFLGTVAITGARRIDALRLSQERYERAVRDQEVGKLASEAELRALRAQLNPHFLFNALTTIGYLIQTAPTRALDTLMRLTSLLRGVLRSEGEFTTLGRELDLVEAYLDIERARFEQRLRVRIDIDTALRDVTIPALLLQPLVENAVKHGVAPLRHGGEIARHLAHGAGRARRVWFAGGERDHVLLQVEAGPGAEQDAL